MKGEHAVLTIPIDLPTALELLQADDQTIELVADTPGVNLRMTFTLTRTGQVADPPPAQLPPGPVEEEHGGGGHICEHCKRSFPTRQGLRLHTTRVHAPKPKTTRPGPDYQCGECGETFTSSVARGEHYRQKHTKAKTSPAVAEPEYKCDDCGLTYRSAAGLGSHRRIHKTDTPTLTAVDNDDDAEPTPAPKSGRECKEDGCTTPLSIYNKGDYCASHETFLRRKGLIA